MSGGERDDLRQEAAGLLAEAGDAGLTVDELRASVRGLVSDAGSTDSAALGVVVNTAMTALGVGVALGGFGQIATAAGVAWAVLNGYPLALAGWRWLVS